MIRMKYFYRQTKVWRGAKSAVNEPKTTFFGE